MCNFHEVQNQRATSFKDKNQDVARSMNKKLASNKFYEQNQFHEEKNHFTSFTKRNINMQKISQKNQHATGFRNKKSGL